MSSPTAHAEQAVPKHRHLVVCANPSSDSFNHAMAQTYIGEIRDHGNEAVLRDLYAIGFDPVLKKDERPGPSWSASPDVASELDHLHAASVLVLVYPIWFGSPPAMLKGYVERVLGANCAHDRFREGSGQPHLLGKPLLSLSTSGAPLTWLDERGQILALRELFDVYLWRGFGMRQSRHLMIDGITENIPSARAAAQLERVREAARQAVSELENGLSASQYES